MEDRSPMDRDPLAANRGQVIAMTILVFVSVGLYLNSLNNFFTNWDDQMIYSNWHVRALHWENICRIFTPVRAATYQPIRVLSYAIDFHFWGLNPLGYHITNVLYYALTCVVIFFILRRLSMTFRGNATVDSHGRTALFGAILFAAHPVHVEAVAWLAARKEVLQGFFFFFAWLLYLKAGDEGGRKRILYLVSVFIAFLLASLSKPSAVVFPVILIVYEIAVLRNRWMDFVKKHRLFFVLSLLISIVFGSILMKVMFDAGGVKPYRGGTLLNNTLISFYAFVYNIKLLAFTINYSAAYTIPVSHPILGARTFACVGMTLLLAGLSVWSLRTTRIFFFCFFFFLVAILPFLNFIPISTLLADRYLFVASFSFCFLLGVAFSKLYEMRSKRFSAGFFRTLSVALFLVLLSGYSFMTVHQNKVWANSYTLWADAVEKYPESNTANALMGVVYMDLGMDGKAAGYLEKAIRVFPYDYHSRNNLGIVYGNLGRFEEGIRELKTAIWLKPEDDTMKINLSVQYQRQKEYEKAEEILNDLLSKHPMDAGLYYRLGLLYREMKRYTDAISALRRSMELAPHIINPYEALGSIYASRLQDKEKAKFYYLKGIEKVRKAESRVEQLRWMIQDLER